MGDASRWVEEIDIFKIDVCDGNIFKLKKERKRGCLMHVVELVLKTHYFNRV